TNRQTYVLDRHGEPVPVGVVGEVFVGGAGVARGYLGRPELNAERFIADPFRADADARLYRTGDLARFLPDGSLEFLGRIDHQVKLRGFRIELGEIQAALLALAGVKDALVVARASGGSDMQLVAYIVADAADVDETRCREALRERLPEYMVPAAFVMLAA